MRGKKVYLAAAAAVNADFVLLQLMLMLGRMVDAIKRQQEGSSFSLSFMSFTFEPLFLFGSLIP